MSYSRCLLTRKRDLTTQDVFQILLRSFHAAHCLIIEQVSKELNIKSYFRKVHQSLINIDKHMAMAGKNKKLSGGLSEKSANFVIFVY